MIAINVKNALRNATFPQLHLQVDVTVYAIYHCKISVNLHLIWKENFKYVNLILCDFQTLIVFLSCHFSTFCSTSIFSDITRTLFINCVGFLINYLQFSMLLYVYIIMFTQNFSSNFTKEIINIE